MRKLVYMLAAAACLTAGAAMAQSASVTIGVGDRDHWRSSDRWHDGYRSYGRSGVVITTHPRHCRTVFVRVRLANGDVIIRKTRRC